MKQPISKERALLYERFRLPYPQAAIDDMLECVDTPQTVANMVVADIGAGTGQLARTFADVTSTVYAVEPEPAMREVGRAALSDCPAIAFVNGTAEQTGLNAQCVDVIVAGNAFHRFHQKAHRELRRILKPGGWVAVLHYRYLDGAWAEVLFSQLAMINAFSQKSKAAWHQTAVSDLLGQEPVLRKRYRQSAAQDWDAFFGAARSGIESPERTDCWFDQFEAINRSVFEKYAVHGKLERHYETTLIAGQPLNGEEHL